VTAWLDGALVPLEQARVSVLDHGPGIDDDRLKNLFDRFQHFGRAIYVQSGGRRFRCRRSTQAGRPPSGFSFSPTRRFSTPPSIMYSQRQCLR